MKWNKSRRAIVCLVAVGSLLVSFSLSANHLQAQTPLAKSLERSTFAVLRIDLERLDLPKTMNTIQANASGLLPAKSVAGFQEFAMPAMDSLKQAGAREVYVTLSMMDVTAGKPAVVLPVDAGNRDEIADRLQVLVGILPPAYGYSVHKTPTAVVACGTETWERLKNQLDPPGNRKFLLRAIEAAGSTPLSLTISIRPDLRTSVSTLWPEQLPKAAEVKLSPRAMMRDVQFLQLRVRSKPEFGINLVVQCEDPDSATRSAEQLRRVWARIGLNMKHKVSSSSQLLFDLELPQLSQLAYKLQQENAFMQQSNNLKQVQLGLHNFEAKYGYFPPRMTVSVAKRPLLSWRVHLLPFIEEHALYSEFHLDEPWSSPHNKRLIERMPRSYESLVDPPLQPGRTCIQAPMMSGSYWNGTQTKPLTHSDIPDGNSNTLCFVVSPRDRAVTWTKPDDFEVEAHDLVASLFGDRDRIQVAFFDSSVRTIPRTTSPETWKNWLTHDSGQPIPQP